MHGCMNFAGLHVCLVYATSPDYQLQRTAITWANIDRDLCGHWRHLETMGFNHWAQSKAVDVIRHCQAAHVGCPFPFAFLYRWYELIPAVDLKWGMSLQCFSWDYYVDIHRIVQVTVVVLKIISMQVDFYGHSSNGVSSNGEYPGDIPHLNENLICFWFNTNRFRHIDIYWGN